MLWKMNFQLSTMGILGILDVWGVVCPLYRIRVWKIYLHLPLICHQHQPNIGKYTIVPWILWISSNKRHTASPMFYTHISTQVLRFLRGSFFQRCFGRGGAAASKENPRSATRYTPQLPSICASWRWKGTVWRLSTYHHTCQPKRKQRDVLENIFS